METHATASSLLVVLVLFVSSLSVSQTSVVTTSGNFNLSSEFYSASGIQNRRAPQSYRGLFHLTVTIFDQIRLPFEASYASGQKEFRQPFNQFGVSPRVSDWLVLHAGYYSARLSDFTFGDARLLGGGVELTPGPWHFSFLFGRSDAAIQPDPVAGTDGTYKRTMWGGKIGYGDESALHAHFTLWHVLDDSTSVRNPPAGLSPKENLVTSLSFGIPIDGQAVTLQGEVAGAALSHDTRSARIPGKGIGHSLIVPRTSTGVDGAAKLSLAVTPVSFMSIRTTARWVGPGFLSLGYPQTPSDVFEWTLAPSFRLLDNALMLRFSYGQRQNNLRGNKLSTTRRSIFSFGANTQITNELALDLHYSNYGLRSTPKNDTLRVENISQSLTVTPRYLFQAFGATSAVFLTYSLQDSDDKNVVTSQTNRNQTQSISTVWNLTFPAGLSLTTSVLGTSSRLPTLSTSVVNVSESVGYVFFENTLSTGLTLGYSSIKTTTSDGQFSFNVNVSYSLQTWGSLGLTVFNNRYVYGAGSLGVSFRETQATFGYSIGF